jgi:plasmid stabilization system protein ParE
MTGFALHPEVFTDVDDIRQHIAEDNPAAAKRIVTEIFVAIRALVPFPHQGYRSPNLTSRPLRFKPVREYAIAYAPDEKPLWVVAVFHGRRSPRVIAAMLRGREQ